MHHQRPPRPTAPQTEEYGATASTGRRPEDSGGVSAAVHILTEARTGRCVQRLLHFHAQAPCAAHAESDEEWQAAAYRLRRAYAHPPAVVARTSADVLELCADLLLLTDPDEMCVASDAHPHHPAGPDATMTGDTRDDEGGPLLDDIRAAAWRVVLTPLEE
ncbi:hypothetical protein ABZY45_34660 [Streptomyces sp. NPDC006516]|uniref:hypothetical protein n=1 Tax=Streptomyces sp. NPDC006516 TaxID=3154309 RepID=UPI0033AD1169